MCNQGLKMTQLSPGCIPCFPDHLSHFQFYRINLLAQTPNETQGLSVSLSLILFQGPGQNNSGFPLGKGRMNSGRQSSDLASFLPGPLPPPAPPPSHETRHPRVSLGWVWTRLAHLSLQAGRIWLIRTSCVGGGFHSPPPLPLL